MKLIRKLIRKLSHKKVDSYNRKSVIQYDDKGIVKKYKSINEAARENKYSKSHISECCNNKRKNAYGYYWKFCGDDK